MGKNRDDRLLAQMRIAIEETVESAVTRIGELEEAFAASHGAHATDGMPSLVAFTSDAFEASTETTSEAKRRLLGDIIAKRFAIQTDSTEDVSLRVALRIMETTTEAQLLLTACVWVKQLSTDVQGGTEPAIEAALAERYGSLISQMVLKKYGLDDFDHLEAVGACRQGSRSSGAFLGGDGDGASQWLRRRGLQTSARPSFSDATFPILSRWTRMLQHPTAEEQSSGKPPSIEDLSLTPAGRQIADIVVTRLSVKPL
jgi:hypothetical protein